MIKTEFGATTISTTSNDSTDSLCEVFADLMVIFKAIEKKFSKEAMLYLLMKCVEYMQEEEDKNNERQ